MSDKEYEEYKKHSDSVFPAVSLMGQAGIKVTSSYVPGLFLGTAFQYNLFGLYGGFDKPMKMGLAITAGYAF